MAHRLTKEAITTYVPAVREVVGTPAYTTVTYQREAVTRWIGADTTPRLPPSTNGYAGVALPIRDPGRPVTTYVDVPVYTFHPAVIAVPGRDAATITDSQLGWNAGAQSVDTLAGDFVVRCKVDAGAVGVLVGIQPVGGVVASFNAIEHGVLISRAQNPAAVERGGIKTVGEAASGPLQIVIERVAGQVRLLAGDVLAYVSPTLSEGDMVLSSVMYAGADYVDDPEFGSVAALESSGDWGWGEGFDLPLLRASSGWGWGGSAYLNDGYALMSIDMGMQAIGDDYASMVWVMSEPALLASSLNDANLAVAVVDLPLTMAAFGVAVEVGSMVASIGLTMRSGDYDYGEASLAIDSPSVFALSTEALAGEETVTDALIVGDFYFVDPVAYATLVNSFSVGSSFDLLLKINIDLADHLVLNEDTDLGLIILALLENRIGLADTSVRNSRDVSEYIDAVTGLAGLYDFTGSTYSTNITTGAVTRYAGFDFAGFCKAGMDTYAYRKDGLYLIGGETDSGDFIGTRADFPADDFGTAQGKRVGNIFMGLATDGQVYVRTTEDSGQEMTYRAYHRRSEHRADMQRGRDSRFWRLRLEVVEGSHAELDNVEWVLTQTGRRSK